jgi:type II secretory pathway pseudopilin PulG
MPEECIRKHHQKRGFSYIETMLAVTVASILTAAAIPAARGIMQKHRSNGDVRAVSTSVALAKLRAAANFTHARVYVDRAANTLQVQVWDRTANTWVAEGPLQSLSDGDTFGYGSLSTPPTNTQSAIGQAPACQTDSETAANSTGTISNTSCLIFNSRGVPIDHAGTITGDNAVYLTDGSSVYGVTVSATAVLRTWRTDIGAANWTRR